jgi:hypothetical protein
MLLLKKGFFTLRDWPKRNFEKTPDQLNVGFMLRTREAVRLTLKKTYEQSSSKVRAWLKEEYPKIHRRAKRKGAEVHGGGGSLPNLSNGTENGEKVLKRSVFKHLINLWSKLIL